jgi:two-component system, OmpR family, alkaline phosphatase synthesis response regulator PhoP
MDQNTKKIVLVVDDELAIRRLIGQILSWDYAVIEAQDGREAVDVAWNEAPDLILMDMMMPKMDGLTACCAIKQNPAMKDIPIVMLTAVGYDLNRKLAEDVAGVNAYITKPFESKLLLNTVRRLISLKSPTSDEAREEDPNKIVEAKE